MRLTAAKKRFGVLALCTVVISELLALLGLRSTFVEEGVLTFLLFAVVALNYRARWSLPSFWLVLLGFFLVHGLIAWALLTIAFVRVGEMIWVLMLGISVAEIFVLVQIYEVTSMRDDRS